MTPQQHRELDAKVAEAIGWELSPPDLLVRSALPKLGTNPIAALIVLEYLEKAEWEFELHYSQKHYSFTIYGNGKQATVEGAVMTADETMPLAICNALIAIER